MPVVPVGGSRSVATATGETPYPAARRDASPHHTTAPVVVATVDNLQRAVEEVKRTVRKAKREIIEGAHPAHEARANGKKMSILRACRAVWRDVNGGYPSPEALYDYCHSHKTEF